MQERLQAVAADGATAPDTVQELEAMQAAIQATPLPDDVVADVRAYFDLTSLFWAFYDGLGLTASEFNRSMGGHQPELPVATQSHARPAGSPHEPSAPEAALSHPTRRQNSPRTNSRPNGHGAAWAQRRSDASLSRRALHAAAATS